MPCMHFGKRKISWRHLLKLRKQQHHVCKSIRASVDRLYRNLRAVPVQLTFSKCSGNFKFFFFSNSLIHNDPLHVIFRGFAPSFVSSAIVIAVKAHAFGRGLVQDNYNNAFESAARFAKVKGYDKLSLTEFSRSNLGLELGEYPEVSCKGADVKTLIFWVESKLQAKT